MRAAKLTNQRFTWEAKIVLAMLGIVGLYFGFDRGLPKLFQSHPELLVQPLSGMPDKFEHLPVLVKNQGDPSVGVGLSLIPDGDLNRSPVISILNEAKNLPRLRKLPVQLSHPQSVKAEIDPDDSHQESAVGHRQLLYVDPQFVFLLHAISPDMERFISHRAYMLGGQFKSDDWRTVVHSEEYSFFMALFTLCPDCIKGLFFYEKNMAGKILGMKEAKKLFKTSDFYQMVEAANSDGYIAELFIN